jgi:hypothetical protein
MTDCEREGCTEPGRAYYIDGGVVHSNLTEARISIGTSREVAAGWHSLCSQHALRDLGVAFS